ncbi:DUF805 domain-containing protein [Aeromonas enteropelogenes]|uniref:DUF805 domain-containing protein n=1 Tax=Aeromonas enteropelogenes TaxID=29489 RepID=UPI003B9F10EF
MNWYLAVLKKYAVFSGRAHRTEYWMFVLFNLLAVLLMKTLDKVLGSNELLGGIYSLAVLLPALAVAARRLHDTDRTGWWLLIGLIPVVGTLVLIYFLVCQGNSGPNRFGDDPKAPAPQGFIS